MNEDENINKMKRELKTAITTLLFAFTGEYGAPGRRDTYPLVLPVMRTVLEESIAQVKAQQGNPMSDDKYYIKKPIRVRAFRLGYDKTPRWFDTTAHEITKAGIYICTLEGKVLARTGDYIIEGIIGELYPCKARIFEASYNVAHNLIEEDFI